MRIFKRLIVVCLFVILAPVVLALLGLVIPYPFVEADEGERNRRILLISNTIHTDIAIPIDAETLQSFSFVQEANVPILHPDARWLVLGWGSRAFYMETPNLADIKFGPALRALTLDQSVMHVDVWSEVDQTDPAVQPIELSDKAYAALLAEISGTFTRVDGMPQPIEGFAFGASDRFYEAEGWFNALLGCNIWTSRMLHSAAIKTGIWNPLPFLLTSSLRMFNPLPS